MKYSKKMVLVDLDQYEKSNSEFDENHKTKYTKDLDIQISAILQNEILNDYDKCQLYLETLRKYLYFVQEDIKNKEMRTAQLNNDLKNILSICQTECKVKPAVKRLSNGQTPMRRSIRKSPRTSITKGRRVSTKIPRLKKTHIPIVENWVSLKSKFEDE